MKKVVNGISVLITIAILMSAMMTVLASGPNRGELTTNGYVATGHVYMQPSYEDTGNKHACQGRVRVIVQLQDNSITYSGYSYTQMVPDTSDTHIYSASRDQGFYVGSYPMVQYAFIWDPNEVWLPAYSENETE